MFKFYAYAAGCRIEVRNITYKKNFYKGGTIFRVGGVLKSPITPTPAILTFWIFKRKQTKLRVWNSKYSGMGLLADKRGCAPMVGL